MSVFSFAEAINSKNLNQEITFTSQEIEQISDINDKLKAAVVAGDRYVCISVKDMTDNVGKMYKREGWNIDREMGNSVWLTSPPKAVQVGWRFKMP